MPDRVPVNFLILTIGRTGSTHLRALLDSHSQIRCLGEVFHPGGPYVLAGRGDPLEFLADFIGEPGEDRVGLKLPAHSLRAVPEAFSLLADVAVPVIRLVRPNLLALFLSLRFAEATGIWHSNEGQRAESTVRVDIDALKGSITDNTFYDNMLDEVARGRPCFRITYEELGDSERLGALQRFLGVPVESLASPFLKLRAGDLAEGVENWDEVVRALEGDARAREWVSGEAATIVGGDG